MTHEQIAEQARRAYPRDHYTHHMQREAYAAALMAERTKPQPSTVEEVMDVVKEEVSHEPDRWRVLARLTKLFTEP